MGPKPQSHTPLDLSPGLWFWGVGSPNHSPRTPWILALDCGLGVLGVRTTVWRLLESVGDCWRLLERAGDCWKGLETAGDCWKLLETAGDCWRLLESGAIQQLLGILCPEGCILSSCRNCPDPHRSFGKVMFSFRSGAIQQLLGILSPEGCTLSSSRNCPDPHRSLSKPSNVLIRTTNRHEKGKLWMTKI